MWAWLNPAKWVKGAKLAAQLELLEKLAAAQEKISELQSAIDELREQLRASDTENEALRGHIQQLERTANRKQSVRFERNAVWTGEGADERAHCQACYGKDDKLIPMQIIPHGTGSIVGLCGVCKSSVTLRQGSSEQAPPRRRPGWMDGYR